MRLGVGPAASVTVEDRAVGRLFPGNSSPDGAADSCCFPSVNQGTLYPVLLKLEQEGAIASRWGVSENNRKAKYYSLTRAGRRQLESEVRQWEETAEIMARLLLVRGERA